MWILVSPPGIERASLALQDRFLTYGPPGKSQKSLNTKVHLTLNFPELKLKADMEVYFLGLGKKHDKNGTHTNSLAMYPGILILPRDPIHYRALSVNTRLVDGRDIFYSAN